MKQRSYRFTQLADSDADQIWDSIADDNPDAADRFISEIYQRVRLLAQFPALDIADRTWLVTDPCFSFQ